MDALYQRLLAFTLDGVYRYTFEDGRILFANQGLVNILGLECAPDEIIGKHLRDFMIYTEEEGMIRRQLKERGEIHDFEYHFKTLSGEDKWVIHDSFIVEDPTTRGQIVEAIVKDITYRKKAERLLAAEKERLAVTLRSIGDAVIATDVGGRILLINGSAEQLTGWRESEALSRPIAEVFRIVSEKTRIPAESPVDRVIRDGVVVGLANDTVLIARDGTEHIIADSGAPIRNVSSGAIEGVVLVFRDVTDQYRARRELEQAERESRKFAQELSDANAELLEANKKLKEMDRQKSEFLATVSHELRTPLATTQGAVDNLLSGMTGQISDKQKELLDIIARNTARLARLIENLLDLSRIDAGRFQMRKTYLDLKEPVQHAVTSFMPLARKAGHKLDAMLPPAPLMVMADHDKVVQVVCNLLDNAIRFATSSINVSLSVAGRMAVISVHDDGPEIPEEHLPLLFQRYLKFDFLAVRGNIGLGLSIVRAIAEAHGGAAWCENTAPTAPGKRFIVHLPCRAEAASRE